MGKLKVQSHASTSLVRSFLPRNPFDVTLTSHDQSTSIQLLFAASEPNIRPDVMRHNIAPANMELEATFG